MSSSSRDEAPQGARRRQASRGGQRGGDGTRVPAEGDPKRAAWHAPAPRVTSGAQLAPGAARGLSVDVVPASERSRARRRGHGGALAVNSVVAAVTKGAAPTPRRESSSEAIIDPGLVRRRCSRRTLPPKRMLTAASGPGSRRAATAAGGERLARSAQTDAMLGRARDAKQQAARRRHRRRHWSAACGGRGRGDAALLEQARLAREAAHADRESTSQARV